MSQFMNKVTTIDNNILWDHYKEEALNNHIGHVGDHALQHRPAIKRVIINKSNDGLFLMACGQVSMFPLYLDCVVRVLQ